MHQLDSRDAVQPNGTLILIQVEPSTIHESVEDNKTHKHNHSRECSLEQLSGISLLTHFNNLQRRRILECTLAAAYLKHADTSAILNLSDLGIDNYILSPPGPQEIQRLALVWSFYPLTSFAGLTNR